MPDPLTFQCFKMPASDPCKKNSRSRMSLRSLRLSLKFRPGLLKLILKMRQSIRKRNILLKSLKDRLRQLDSNKAEVSNTNSVTNSVKDETMQSVSNITQYFKNINAKEFKDSFTQTDNKVNDQETKPESPKEDSAWGLKENGDAEKSIAEQVKEAAQMALQDNGMVYVESAGMYYDYKTGYYYNSELGLYYHNDTGCYYYYSDDKQFVFHSYPDMSKVNASLIAHQKKKARKLKRERKPEDDVENLTKHLSQEKEEDGGNPKKPRKNKKIKKERKVKKKENKETDDKKKGKMQAQTEEMDITQEEDEEKEVKAKQVQDIVVGIDGDKDETEEFQNEYTADIDSSNTYTQIESKYKASNVTNNQDDSEQSEHIDNAMDMFENNANSKDKTENVGDTDFNNVIGDKKDSGFDTGIQFQDDNKLEPDTYVCKIDDKEEEKQEVCEELEDGECSDTESDSSGSESDASTSTVSDEDCVAKHHPPCMRVIVRETKLQKLKVGSLFLITKDGGTIGREGEHAILLNDHNVSRNHLDIKYDVLRKTYIATDLGSKNGSILNGVRMSESQDVSLPLDVLHGSTIQLGETKLLCHIHPGHTTCGQCEPGLLMQVAEEKKAAYTRTVSVKKQHELELARLKNIYVPQRLAIEEKPYNDRAQARRETVGSTNHAEKTQSTDLDTAIASENKGFKLLQKMGWSKGEGLGKDSQGEIDPVPLISNDGKAGLGTSGAVAPPSNVPKPRVVKNNLAAATLRLASRTKMLQPPARAFQAEEDGDE